jgi:signal transduction histidine kinase
MGVAMQREIQPMHSILVDYYFTLLDVLAILLLIGGVGVAVYLAMWMRLRNKLETLEQERADARVTYDREYFRALHNHLHSAIAHELVRGLDFISKKSAETLERLGEEQNSLREKQKRIIAKVYELDQHGENILKLFDPEGNGLETEFLNVRRLIEGVVSTELILYADSEGVTLMAHLDDVEPTLLDRDQTLVAIKNVIHNSIKYSFPGGVVKIVLSLEIDKKDGAEKTICIEVTDTGKGVPEKDQAKIFELRKRSDGLIEPGSGLGLYLARKAARRQGGDVVLVSSTLNQGSVFKITLPYVDFEE